MRPSSWILALTLASCALVGSAGAQGVGSKVPAVELVEFTQTAARSFDDYLGRAVLIEFFAFW